jgi:hypothetical protein
MQIAFIPKSLLRWFPDKDLKQLHLNILISNIIVVLFFSVDILSIINFLPHQCLFQELFGVDCPGCGMVSGLSNFFQLRIKEAFHLNPVSLLLGCFIILQILLATIALNITPLSVGIYIWSKKISYVIVFLLFINFIYKILITI